jgi:small GTP-binding protein
MTEEPILPLKCVLLGETAVGKTALISRFVENKFSENFVSTLVGCYSSKDIFYPKFNRNVKYEIWDTAGQEKFRSINKIFYQDTSIAILVFDITRKDTFQALKEYWYTEVRDNSPKDVIIAIAANKNDLYEYEEVTDEEAKKFAKSINAIYHQTSASKGTGINELFESIGSELLKPENIQEFIRKTTTYKKMPVRLNSESFNSSKINNEEKNEVRKDIKKNCCI